MGRFRAFNAARAALLAVVVIAGVAGAIEVPGSGGRLVVGGFLDGLAVAPTEGGPEQIPGALLDLHLDGEATRWLRGRLDLRARAGGPFIGGHQGVFNFNHEFQNYQPSLDVNEAFADIHLRRADLRVGIQKVAWGKLDAIPPTDVVNPRGFHDPIIEDYEERKIGIPMLLGTYYLPDVPRVDLTGLRATLLWAPFAVPPRLALIPERWFPTAVAPNENVFIPVNRLPPPFRPVFPNGLRVPVDFETQNNAPAHALDQGAVGFRLGGTWREVDLDLYHYTGPETGPDAELRSTAFLVVPNPPHVRSVAVLRQRVDTIHMTGGDVATTLGGFTVRGEAAWFLGKPYLRPANDLVATIPLNQVVPPLLQHGKANIPLAPLFPTLDSFEWGVGTDYVWRGWQPLVQLNQVVLLQSAPPLVISNPETRVGGTIRKRLLAERLELEFRAAYEIERSAWFVFPRLSYQVTDDFRVRLGYLALGGPRVSLLGEFRENDEFVMQARYSF